MVSARLRASDADREAVAMCLREHYAAGRLSTDTLDHRVAGVYGAQTRDELGALLMDLPPAQPLRPRLRERVATAFDPRRRHPPLRLTPGGYLPPGKRLLIGRSVGCDIVLTDTTVSRCHADLHREGATWVLRDLDSTNGVAVNGLLVKKARLAPGDQIALGRARLEWLPDERR